ncbi:MAG: CPBP family intramembrane metalloprotease [Deltaproteobacteria bacterium]|nr:CPBP family intramembrane metalloprotease [Deltaproteobacteria bacterium]
MTQTLAQKRLVQALVVWILVIVGIRIFSLFDSIPFVYENLSTFIAILLIYPPVLLSLKDKTRIEYWRLDLLSLKTGLKFFLIASLVVFPCAFLVNHFYQRIAFGNIYHAGSSAIWPYYMFMQLCLIAFPEEFFFRGYLQGVFNGVFVKRRPVFSTPFGWGPVMVSAIFALSHSLITLQWWHGFIFFPSLCFAWLKEKTGTIWAPILFHWCCNLFAYWVVIHY